ncbi:MAG: tRNA (N(6)-L-threonylcarbamoyladenosine(37)-C(2))-methylthiotransferase MtaB [Candidatus Improbicoccus pseudotrichonymphae]|uniref:tRNA (N(6)-L-threonylcarbamoyladenosine(37)-C(2) )-methylthiotransferase MtaB n=1 Tax=Candidatus Improbicoccus pseudotrichonymphae TaxID=3033792 RepID=A0AA48KVN3_9FIRM|nr:MAG: tRNA (N(6)-L-threonylcarbamoyladenosine(37)-C(2))-methylthiotransferase MtaB [Candidatus Improbicoccus pseudotrichonymphae]
MKTFFIKTFGCKVNGCDSEEISSELICNGWDISCSPLGSDLIVFNSCAVTAESVRKCRQAIRKFKKCSPNSLIIVTGCAVKFLQNNNMEEIDFLLEKPQRKIFYKKILQFLNLKKRNKSAPDFLRKNDGFNHDFSIFSSKRTRAFLKVEDGCNNFCSYCIIPYVRGSVIKSKPLSEIEKEINALYLKNYREIVISGINLCAVGSDLDFNLMDVIDIVRKKFSRIRLGSLDPSYFIKNKEQLCALLERKEICPSFHLSLQSGSDEILSRMNRKYNVEDYMEITEKIKKKISCSTITTDLIVGFPGETEKNFEESLLIIKKLNFIKVNVFPFSARENTVAYSFENKIDAQTKNRRKKKAIELSEKISEKEIGKFKNKYFNVLFESKINNEIYTGYSENYIKMHKESQKDLCGEILRIRFC